MGSLETNIISESGVPKHENQSKPSLLNLDYSHRNKKKEYPTKNDLKIKRRQIKEEYVASAGLQRSPAPPR